MKKYIDYLIYRIKNWYIQRKKLKNLSKNDPFIYK